MKSETKSQLQKHIEKNKINVAVVGDKAYWIKNNNIYYSGFDEEGEVDINNAKKIDVFSLSKKDLNFIMNIVDSLNK